MKIDYILLKDHQLKGLEQLPTVFSHPEKNYSHYLSRMGIQYLSKVLGALPPPLDKIELVDFQHIKALPGHIFSVSHTKDCALVASAQAEKFKGIGVDIERVHRTIKVDSEKYFLNSDDSFQGSLLEKWCVKEACFKALSNSGEAIKLLQEAVVIDNNFYFKENPQSRKHNCYEIIKNQEHIFVIAYCGIGNSQVNLNSVNFI